MMNLALNSLTTLVLLCAMLRRVLLFMTVWTVAHQAPLSVGFPRQESWSGLPFPPPGGLPNPGKKKSNSVSCTRGEVFNAVSPHPRTSSEHCYKFDFSFLSVFVDWHLTSGDTISTLDAETGVHKLLD